MIRGFACAALGGSLVAVAAFPASASGMRPAVTISTAATKDMALNNGVYSPTGSGAVLNVNDLMTALNAGNLEVTTGSQHGDIAVEASFHWASANALTLDSYRSIRVDQPVTDAGTGALTLTTNDGGTNGHLQFGTGGNITIWALTNALTINGKPYTLVNTVASLASAIAANPAGNYALAASYDAKVDRTYQQDPITTPFEGRFEGLGNAISHLSIGVSGVNVGLFSMINETAVVSNVHLQDVSVAVTQGGGGALAGSSNGILYGDEVSGKVVANYNSSLGGLIGTGSGLIENCASTAVVIGRLQLGVSIIGGLAGYFSGQIDDSYSSGAVKSGDNSSDVGGLVGISTGPIRHSHASGNVSGPFSTLHYGGLAGLAQGPISDSYATGNIDGGSDGVGGLVGSASGSITRSFATGKIRTSNASIAGGLVGSTDESPITDSYATGGIEEGTIISGGLVGAILHGSASNSYATGKVFEAGQGGFACTLLDRATVRNDYWDTTTSGTVHGVCKEGNVDGVAGLTTQQLQSGLPAGFDPKIWAQDRRINHGFPYLIANPPPQK
jgi:hypothetical protein